MDAESVAVLFERQFGRRATAIARAPGRVNLIGEHTDYNDGFVLPLAIRQSAWVAVAARSDALARVHSREFGAARAWTLGEWSAGQPPDWSRYVAGVAELLRRRGARLPGFDLLVASDLPPGGGLSSSAALEVAAALALAGLSGEPLEAQELIDLCGRAEREFAGVPCGLMDQSASLLGRAGSALLIDCRARRVEPIPLGLDGHELIVIDSGVRHELAGGAYAQRQRECQAAVAYFQKLQPGLRALRDLSSATIRAHALQLDPVAAARALHVCTENERVLAAVEALRRGSLATVGALLCESHASLRDDFEASCPEIDRIVEIVARVPGVLGARLTGGGFGGCAIALARESTAGACASALRAAGSPEDFAKLSIVTVAPGPGAELVRLEGG